MKEVLGKYREFAKRINPNIKVVKGKEWCSYPYMKKMEVPRLMEDDPVGDFLQTIEKQLEKTGHQDLLNRYDDFMWCFLHEMGHLCKPKTYDDSISRAILNKINKMGFNKLANTFYYRLKEERTATKWACDYVINNQKMVMKYNWELVQRYKKYYKSMNLTIDN